VGISKVLNIIINKFIIIKEDSEESERGLLYIDSYNKGRQ